MTVNPRGKYFRKLLFSAAILILVPLIAAVSIFAINHNYKLRAQALNNYEKRIIHSVSSLDQQLMFVTRIPAILSGNDKISELYNSPFDPINSIDIVTLLNHYCQFNSIVSDIYVHVVPHGMVYSSHMRMPDVNNPIGIQINGMDYLDAMQSKDSMYTFVHSIISFPHRVQQELVLYSAPVHTSGDKVIMSITVALNNDVFIHNLIDTLEVDNTMPLVCLLQDNEVVYSNILNEPAYSKLIAAQSDTLQIDGVVYHIFSNASALSGYRYVFAIPENVLLSQDSWLTGVLAMIVLSASFVAIALWLFLRANYTPIHNIYAAVRKHLSQSGSDELESIRDTIELLETHMEELNAQAIVNLGAIKRTFLLDLMNGEWIGDYETLLAQAEELDIPASGQYCAVLIACADMDAFSRFLAPIKLFNAGIMENGYTCCLCVCPTDSAVDTPMTDETLRTILTSASEAMRNRFFDAPGACAGNMYGQLSMVPFSYTEAKAAVELQHITGKSVLLYKDVALLVPTRSESRKPSLNFTILARCITQRDKAGISVFMDNVIRLIGSFDMPMVDMRCIVFDIYNAIFSVAPEFSGKLASVRTIFEQRTRDEIIDLLRSVHCALLESDDASSRQNRLNMEAIDIYIQTHYASHDFSIRTLAAQSGLSLPYFSQLFKKEKGVSPIDYVTSIRIENAQRLLVNTNLRVCEIVDEIGYYSISSFIKRFSEYTGMTPSEFRNRQSSGKEEQQERNRP